MQPSLFGVGEFPDTDGAFVWGCGVKDGCEDGEGCGAVGGCDDTDGVPEEPQLPKAD